KTVMNLVLNAWKKSREKKTAVMITTANGLIDPSVPGLEGLPQGEYAVLTVADNGPGMDERNIKKIFEPFFTSRELGKSGTGLGLTLVRHAVREYRGGIRVTSDAEGNRFELFFPALRPDLSRGLPKEYADEIKGRGRTILVVDDLKDQQATALALLEHLGYRAKAVDSGVAALEAIKKASADLVILGAASSMAGLEAYRMIKRLRPDQKILRAGGYLGPDDMPAAQGLGAVGIVKKPYTILDMAIAIKEELEK
nr:response regulator [Desulfobacula sp.]